jgi:hypothetical protein
MLKLGNGKTPLRFSMCITYSNEPQVSMSIRVVNTAEYFQLFIFIASCKAWIHIAKLVLGMLEGLEPPLEQPLPPTLLPQGLHNVACFLRGIQHDEKHFLTASWAPAFLDAHNGSRVPPVLEVERRPLAEHDRLPKPIERRGGRRGGPVRPLHEVVPHPLNDVLVPGSLERVGGVPGAASWIKIHALVPFSNIPFVFVGAISHLLHTRHAQVSISNLRVAVPDALNGILPTT